MSKSVLPIQTTLRGGLKVISGELGIPVSVLEEAVGCLAEVLSVIELRVLDEASSSALRDRYFQCLNRVKRLVYLLQSTLKNGGVELRRSGVISV